MRGGDHGSRHCAIIVNPFSGIRNGVARAEELAAAFASYGVAAEVLPTAHAGHAIELALDLADHGAGFIVAAGGDGTLNEIAHGILLSDRPHTPLAFLNAGTGGDFVRPFHLPLEPQALADRILQAAPRAIDVGQVECAGENGERRISHFINIASAGFSGDVVRAVNASRLRGRVPAATIFPFYILSGIAGYRPYNFSLTINEDAPFDVTCAAVVVANGRYFGSGLEIAPEAVIDDGFFDVVVVPARSRLGIISALGMVRRGTHLKEPDVLFLRARKVQIEATGDTARRELWLESDGETPGRLPVSYSILPKAMNVLV